MSSRPSRQDSLLAALHRTPAQTTIPEAPPAEIKPSAKNASRKIGKPVQFWLHEEDRKIVRELAAWLAGQGIRTSDSMVVRAALRMSETGADFLAAYRKAAALDGRLRS